MPITCNKIRHKFLDPNRGCKKGILGVEELLLKVQRKQPIDTCFVDLQQYEQVGTR